MQQGARRDAQWPVPPAAQSVSPLLAPLPASAGLAAFLELCAEPLYILGSTRLLFGLRVAVETCAAVAKGAVLLVLVRSGRVPPAIAFSWAQLAYAAVVLVGYVLYFAPRALAAWRQRQPQRQVERQGGGSEGGRPHGGAAVHNTSVGQWAPDLQLLCVSGTFTLQVRTWIAGGRRWLGGCARVLLVVHLAIPCAGCKGQQHWHRAR